MRQMSELQKIKYELVVEDHIKLIKTYTLAADGMKDSEIIILYLVS